MGAFGACAGVLGCARGGSGSREPGGSAGLGDPRDHGHDAGLEAPEHGHAGPAAAGAERFAELAGYCAGVSAIAASEYEARLTAIQARLAAADRGALIVEAGVDMRYLGGPSWGLSERPLLLVIPRVGEPTLIGPAFERGTLDARQGGLTFAVRTWEEHESPYLRVAQTLDDAKVGRTAAVAIGPSVRSFVAEGLAGQGGRALAPGAAVIEGCRRIKSAAELALLRRANEATKAAVALAAPLARVGMTERELADQLRAAQQAAGLDNVWVLALFGPNAAYPHGTPEGRSLAEGDLILVDTGGFLHGYASDITRTWAFPDPSMIDEGRRRAWQVVHDAQSAALAQIRPGVSAGSVDAAARAVIAAAGFDPDYGQFSHRLGHGIGMEVHEGPYLVRASEQLLEPGNTMSNEPGLYLPGEFGIRLEDIVAVGEDGPELFGPRAATLERPFG